LPSQHVWALPPHAWHVPLLLPLQMVPGPEHHGPWSVPPVQHGWPAPPQVAQPPFAHVPPLPPQAEPEATHTPADPQQPPAAQVLPPQQGSPAAPQCSHMLLAAHRDDESRQSYLPGQQVFPTAPQLAHWPFAHAPSMPPQLVPLDTHTRPVPQHAAPEQVPPGQQGSPAPPHAAHTPWRQAVLAAVQVLPEQQGPPAAPHAPHVPFMQTPLPTEAPHATPGPTQVPFTQQPALPPQTLLSQQICPGPPQATPVLVVAPEPQPAPTTTDNKARTQKLNDLIVSFVPELHRVLSSKSCIG
jgi:hypothetical protein